MKNQTLTSTRIGVALFIVVLLLSACKEEKNTIEYIDVVPNFLINERNLVNYGLDYTAEELSESLEDSTRVLVVEKGVPVKFQDITQVEGANIEREWIIDGEEWKSIKGNNNNHPSEFTFNFKNSKVYKIALLYNKSVAVEKVIFVKSGMDQTNETIIDHYKETLTSEKAEEQTEYPGQLNFIYFFDTLYSNGITRSQQESIYKNYLDSLNHYISAETLVSVDGIQDDINDVLLLTFITGDRIKLEEPPTYNNGKLTYLPISKE